MSSIRLLISKQLNCEETYEMKFPVSKPSFVGNEVANVQECLDTLWISSIGGNVQAFENKIASYTGAEYCVCTSNGTTALHLAMSSLGIKSGDEVVVPNLTFGASANAVMMCGATPVFADVDKQTWNLSVETIQDRITENTVAIMPVHIYGNPCNMTDLQSFCSERKLLLIEDAAEALGAKINRKHVGTYGDAGTFSFFSNKLITTGEGGAVITNDATLAEKMRVMRDHGMSASKRYWHEFAGFNYRMTNIQAAIGVGQIDRITNLIRRRHQIERRYKSALRSVDGIVFQKSLPEAQSICWLFTFLHPKLSDVNFRSHFVARLDAYGIESRNVFFPLAGQPAFEKTFFKGTLPISARISSEGISLPTYYELTDGDIDHIVSIVKAELS